MLPVSHCLAGFLILPPAIAAGLVDPSSPPLLLTAVFSVIPDVDAFWTDNLADHHGSLLHTPIFWLVPSLFGVLTGFHVVGYIVAAATGFHLLCDYVTCRSSGVMLFFPFSHTEHGLYPFDHDKGDFDPLTLPVDELRSYLWDYLDNRAQVGFELAVGLAGAATLLLL